MALLYKIPDAFANPLLYERIGAIIKEKSTGHIVGHVQELSGWGLIKGLPIPGGNPLSLGVEALQSAQLVQIQQTLSTVQTLATVGAVASVATLGVCVAGFATVLGKLRRMEGKLDQALSQLAELRGLVNDLNIKQDALPLAKLQARIEVVELARHFDDARRRTSLERALDDLTELRHYYATLLAQPGFCALGTDQLLTVLDTQERFIATCEAELYAEFLLSGSAQLLEKRLNKQQQLIQQFAGADARGLYRLAEEGDRKNGAFLVTSPDTRKARVLDVMAIRTESTNRLSSWPHLALHLSEKKTPPLAYLEAVEELNTTSESPLLVLDCRP